MGVPDALTCTRPAPGRPCPAPRSPASGPRPRGRGHAGHTSPPHVLRARRTGSRTCGERRAEPSQRRERSCSSDSELKGRRRCHLLGTVRARQAALPRPGALEKSRPPASASRSFRAGPRRRMPGPRPLGSTPGGRQPNRQGAGGGPAGAMGSSRPPFGGLAPSTSRWVGGLVLPTARNHVGHLHLGGTFPHRDLLVRDTVPVGGGGLLSGPDTVSAGGGSASRPG